jgi:hypothetical protein
MPKIQEDQIEVGEGPQHALTKYGPGPGWELAASRLTDNGSVINVPGDKVNIGNFDAESTSAATAMGIDAVAVLAAMAARRTSSSLARLLMECSAVGQADLFAIEGSLSARLRLRPGSSSVDLGFLPTDQGTLDLNAAVINLNAASVNKAGTPLGVVASVSALAQTASIGGTSIFIEGGDPPAGLYRLSYYLVTTVAGTSGTVKATFSWADPGDVRSVDSALITFGTLAGPATGTLVIRSNGGALDYSTTVADGVGDPEYALYITLERLQ